MELDFNIQPLDEAAMTEARERQAQLAKANRKESE